MKNTAICIVALVATILIPSSAFSMTGRGHQNVTTRQSRSMVRPNGNISGKEGEAKQKIVYPVEVAGSRLPDCLHACGSCSPCKLVIVSSTCDSLHQAETCPVSYRCMCNNKSYPVP